MTQDLTTIESEGFRATVSALGAELQSLSTPDNDQLLWHGDPKWWGGRAPLLFPIVGRAPNDQIAVGDHRAPMKQHGFARRSQFHLVAQTPESCTFELHDSEQTRAVYPFAFSLAVRYRLSGNSLQTAVEVTNNDTAPMPFGFGFHPAFAWPLPGAGGKAHRVKLHNGAEPPMIRLQDGLVPPERHPSPFVAGQLTLSPTQFDDDAMIFPEGAGGTLSYGVENGPQLHFSFENLPNLALWTKPGAPYLCIEPWHGMAATTADDPEMAHRPYCVTLAPGATSRFAFNITIAL
ncbi:aldose 1-epimerase [Actibacterium atlanticum]|uniref:Aldose 1-epimerase n=1 Tax=Actibacterium atlanticum TaxID=1461693 RepID=A0A058ZP05_9RHOB|nr:aldose 1-epimerase family protein [Actibacterium atlanticum]KCV82970.1 aldose 1-epimerase [Actibacterium atlanticum]